MVVKEAEVHSSAQIGEGVQLGNNARVGAFVLIDKNVIIGDWAYIEPYTHVKQHVPPYVIVGKNGVTGINGRALSKVMGARDRLSLKKVLRRLIRGEAGEFIRATNEYEGKLIDFFEENVE